MSWLNLNQSLSSLKGQITNFASEVLSEGNAQESSDSSSRTDFPSKELEEKCTKQELEIAELKKLTEELQATLQSERLNKKNGLREEDSNWYWDPPQQKDTNKYETIIQDLKSQISALKQQENTKSQHDPEELTRLREENKNLTKNLEDLDHQHQLAMEKLLTLKKELQKSFEVLKEEHEQIKSQNDEFVNERRVLLNTIKERDKHIEKLSVDKSDLEIIHHKYLNLEKVHSILKENVEKFQEENQDLHEEVFKLQEIVTKYEHEIEVATKHTEMSNSVPREAFDELMKELNDLKAQKLPNKMCLEETNIDDNAKSVIENLKRQMHDLEHKLSLKEGAQEHNESLFVKADKIMQLYNKYINFDIPVDYIGEIQSSHENIVIFKLESVFKAINMFKKDIDTLEHKLSEKNHNINHLQTQIDDLSAENDFLTTDMQHFETELNEMRKNNDFLIKEIATLKNSSKLQPIIETHEDNIVKLETELDTCTKKNKTFESEIKKIEKELSEVTSEKKMLQDSLIDMRNKYTTMLGELEAVKNQTKAVEVMENNTKAVSSQELKKAVDEIDDLKSRLMVSNARNEQLAIDLSILDNDKVLLTRELDDIKQTLMETLSDHQQLYNLKTTLETKLSEVEKKLDVILKNKNDIEAEKIKLQERLSILEKDRAMKNVSASEIDKMNREKSQITEKLQFIEKQNHTLIETTNKLNNEISSLHKANDLLEKENEALKQNTSICVNTDELQEVIRDLKAKLIQQEISNEPMLKLQEENQRLEELRMQLEFELANTDEKIRLMERDFEKLFSELSEKDTIIDKLQSNLNETNSSFSKLNETITDLNNTMKIKDEELKNLSTNFTETKEKPTDISEKFAKTIEELSKMTAAKDLLHKQVLKLTEEIESSNKAVKVCKHRSETIEKTCNDYKATIDAKDKVIKELNQSIAELKDKLKTLNHTDQHGDKCATLEHEKEMLEHEVNVLKQSLKSIQEELIDLKRTVPDQHESIQKYNETIEVLNKEKAELINLVNLKHNESMQYHNEIQRLNSAILEQTSNFTRMIEDKEKEMYSQAQKNSCSKCEELEAVRADKEKCVKALNETINDYSKITSEWKQANITVANLTEKCENLEKSLGVQLETVKKLTAENAQLSEQEENSNRELERLRRHLVELEENYTQELMASEHKLTECQTRLHQVEERAKQTSTVYTSNSIRANQEVETLRNQIKLLEKQREDVQVRLSEAEDAKNRSEAALTNLQVVLEQFQLDKERDIHTATEKIRNKTEEVKRENASLKEELARLNAKLEEALTGLQAAARLGDQVETKTAQINDLKEQVRTLQISVAAAEERYYNATSNQQDKVDKNLVKNLIINYVLTAAHNSSNKTQVLRILSTVLDFNQQECEKLGLVRVNSTQESLAAEFVKFLQNESKPRAPLPNMMSLGQGGSRSTTPNSASRKSSTIGPSPSIEIGHTRNPSTSSNNLLFQNIDNIETASTVSIESETRRGTLETSRGTLDTGVTQHRDTEGAILKHVLRDM